MEQDQLQLSLQVLQYIISLIEKYTLRQTEKLKELSNSFSKLGQEWIDDKSFGELNSFVASTTKNCIEAFEQMNTVYKKFYLDTILDIRKNLSTIIV